MWRLAATFVLATGEPVDAAGDAVDPEEVEPIQPDIVAMERAGFKAFMAQPDVVPCSILRPKFLEDIRLQRENSSALLHSLIHALPVDVG